MATVEAARLVPVRARRRETPHRLRRTAPVGGPAQPEEQARAAALVYGSDAAPGLRRERRGRGFTLTGPDGPVRDAETLARVRALAVPPAWTDVWIATDPRSHIQATGRDARGRKQYRYHDRWRKVRDQTKFERLADLACALPSLRARVDEHLRMPGLPREKIVALIVRLLERTLIRVGNEEYARANDSYGLTTMKDEHVRVDGPGIRFRFRGKSGREHDIDLRDARAARIVKRCRDLPGQDLFQYLDQDGTPRSVGSGDVNAYLREATDLDLSAKDFRTWAGTVLAAMALAHEDPPESDANASRAMASAIEHVAKALGNTRAVARKSYVHPQILERYADGSLAHEWDDLVAATPPPYMAAEEAAVAKLLTGGPAQLRPPNG